MPVTTSSPTLLAALRGLGRTDGRVLLRSGVEELVARGVLELEAEEVPDAPSAASGWRLVLLDGPERTVHGRLLVGVALMVADAPSEVVDGRRVRDLAGVARHLARRPGARARVVDLALGELAANGLVATEERTVLRQLTRAVRVRTPAGEAVLARAPAEPVWPVDAVPLAEFRAVFDEGLASPGAAEDQGASSA